MWRAHSLEGMAREGPLGGDAGAKTRIKWGVDQHTGLLGTTSDTQRSAGRPERFIYCIFFANKTHLFNLRFIGLVTYYVPDAVPGAEQR